MLRAISHLQAEGFVRMERGHGVYAIVNPIPFGLGPQRWFEQNLIYSNKLPSRQVLSVAALPAPEKVAERFASTPAPRSPSSSCSARPTACQ